MKPILAKLFANESATQSEMCATMVSIAEGEFSPTEIAAFLAALQVRGATTAELIGLRDGLLQTGRSISFPDHETIDIVGTGGDGRNTFNISTCASFVVAGAGFAVSKHGNYAASSISGASNVLEHFGVKFTADEAQLRRSLDESGMAYLHAPLFALGMKHVAPVRRELGLPTVFNRLGPLINPSRPRHQLLGTANLAQQRSYKTIFEQLGTNYGIVTSIDGCDEISLTSSFKIITPHFERILKPSDLGLPTLTPESLSGGASKEEAAEIFLSVLENRSTSAQRDVVIANAAAAIGVIRPALSIADTIAMARESLSSERALSAFRKFIALNAH